MKIFSFVLAAPLLVHLAQLPVASSPAPPAPSAECRSLCRACPADADAPRAVRVKFYNRSRMTAAQLAVMLETANRLWLRYGVRVEPSMGDDAVAVVISADGALTDRSDRSSVLGTTTFVRGHATPYIRLALDTAEALAEEDQSTSLSFRARPVAQREAMLADILGVALAHELAHYLLDTAEHSPSGLLKARMNIRHMAQPDAPYFQLTRAQQHVLCPS